MKYITLLLTLLWFLLSTYLSHQNGIRTAQTSMKLAEMLGKTGFLGDEGLNGKLRRAAHVVVFLVLTVLLSLTLAAWDLDKRWVCVVFVWCFVDEVTKVFVPGRHCSMYEIGLNMIGCLIGMLGGFVI